MAWPKKKNETTIQNPGKSTSSATPAQGSVVSAQPSPPPSRREAEPSTGSTPRKNRQATGSVHVANIGKSIHIKGELTGDEDLVILGGVTGEVLLCNHKLTIAAGAQVEAEVRAKVVTVLGSVTGNITASELIEVSAGGAVEGDLSAPRVVLADGSSFRGSIDMSAKETAAASTKEPATTQTSSPATAQTMSQTTTATTTASTTKAEPSVDSTPSLAKASTPREQQSDKRSPVNN